MPRYLAALIFLVLPYFLRAQLTEEKLSRDSVERQVTRLTDLAWDSLEVNPESALQYSKEALAIAKANQYVEGIGLAESFLGLCYSNLGQFESSVDHYLKSIRVYDTIPDKRIEMVASYNNIALDFQSLGSASKALQYFHLAASIEEKQENKLELSRTYTNISTAHYDLGNIDSALYYTYRALEIVNENGGGGEYKSAYINLASLYLQDEQLDSAFLYARRSLDAFRGSNDYYNSCSAYLIMSSYYIGMDNPDYAKIYLDSAHSIAVRIDNLKLLVTTNDHYANLYEIKGDYKNALQSLKTFMTQKDSLTGIQVQDSIARISMQYENEKKENHIRQLEAEQEIKNLTIEKQASQRNYLFGIIALVLLILLLISVALKNNRRKSRKLAEQNEIISQSHREIENLIRESHHRIKNNLQVVSSLLKLQSKNVASEDAKNTLLEAFNRVKTIALMHQRLQGSDTFKTIRMDQFIEQLTEGIETALSDGYSDIDLDLQLQPIEMETDNSISLGLIINEVITNSFKYAFPDKKGIIEIELKKKGGNIFLNLSDNGKGFPENFDPEKTNSLGFKIVKSLTSKLKGSLHVHSDNGAHISITIPYERAA